MTSKLAFYGVRKGKMNNLPFKNYKAIRERIMSNTDDRLLRESEILEKARERFGLGAIKIQELLRDCETVDTMPIQIPGKDREKV